MNFIFLQRGDFEWDITEVDILKSSFTWFMGPAQLVGGMLCQKYGGKITFGYSNLIMAILTFMIPFAAEFGIKVVIIIRVLQGFAGVCILQGAGTVKLHHC